MQGIMFDLSQDQIDSIPDPVVPDDMTWPSELEENQFVPPTT